MEPDTTLTVGPDGTRMDWRDVRPMADLSFGTSTKAVSLAAEGTSVWLLAGDWRRTALVRATGRDESIVIATFGWSAMPLAASAANSSPAFAGLAPDDSAIVVRAEAGYRRFGGDLPLAVVRTDDGSVSMHAGSFAGFVPAGLFPGP
jgi:hypothetical protein